MVMYGFFDDVGEDLNWYCKKFGDYFENVL